MQVKLLGLANTQWRATCASQTPARLTQAVNALEITLTRADVYDLIEAREGVPLP